MPNDLQALFKAVITNNLEKVKTLLKDNPCLALFKYANGDTLLHFAAAWGNREAAELLLANQADVNAKSGGGPTALHWGAFYRRRDLSEPIEPRVAGMTPLHLAASRGHKAVAELLLANQAKLDAEADNGETPLHWAAAEDHEDVVELLLAKKADVNVKDYMGHTPLRLAEAEGHDRVAELLRQHGGVK